MTGQGSLYEWTHIHIHIMYTYRDYRHTDIDCRKLN